MQPERQIKELLVHYISGNLDDPERMQVKEWIAGSTVNSQYFNELKRVYQLTRLTGKPDGFDREKGWERVRAGYSRIYLSGSEVRQSSDRLVLRRYLLPAAACLLAVFILGSLFNRYIAYRLADPSKELCEINVPLGSISHVSLPDGSSVWLNAGSKLNYSGNTFNKDRMVNLEGEAYFEVLHKKSRQFVVSTSGIDVKVYGTQFNVESYPEESEITTTLVSGKIALGRSGSPEPESFFLEPGQVARLDKNKLQENGNYHLSECLIIETSKDKIRRITSWKEKRWYIGGETLDKLAVKLERKFNVDIVFKDESIKKYKFSGTFDNESFEQIMQIIAASSPIRYEMDKNIVILKADEAYKKEYDRMLDDANE